MPFRELDDSSDSPLINPAVAVSLVALFTPMEAWAKNGAYGWFENRAASMIHPATMMALFGTSVYAGYLGWQWRRLRELGDEIKDLSVQLPTLSSGKAKSPVREAISAINAEIAELSAAKDVDSSRIAILKKDVSLLQGATELDAQIQELSATRKKLQGSNLRDKHWVAGSWLLGAGVLVSILGAFNTYMRAEKLFPGPHLYAGMGITALWAAAAALVPAMQKGNEAARVGHIALNGINVALFAWQVVTGFDIAVKVWGFTHW
jgi:Protein of unknown function (DUF4079)